VQRFNQFDQFSELGQPEKSRRGIWSRDLTCDRITFRRPCNRDFPPDKRNVGNGLRRPEVGFRKA